MTESPTSSRKKQQPAIDIHVHVAEPQPSGPKGLTILARLLLRRYLSLASGKDNELQLLGWLDKAHIDRAVLLALDAAYSENGVKLHQENRFEVSGQYIQKLCRKNGKALFGASIHPYRKDACAALEEDIRAGACLVKWVPSVQNIAPDLRLIRPFYEILAHHRLPLLTHVGNEHSLLGSNNSLNHPHRLLPALEQGVTIIAAHCGARLFLHERCYFNEWEKLAQRFPNCYGDLAAMCLPTRIKYLRRIKNCQDLSAKVLYASDFPASAMPWSFVRDLGIRGVRRIQQKFRFNPNPLDESYSLLRAFDFPEAVFSRAGELLRIPSSSQ